MAARREVRSLEHYPGAFPETFDEAYAIQRAAIRLSGRAVLGWKVARVSSDVASAWGADRIVGPVFDLWDGEVGMPAIAAIQGGYCAAEAELQLRIASGPGRASGVGGSIGEIRIGIEIAGSPYAAINKHGPAVTVSDFGNNMGLVLGPRIYSTGDGRFDATVRSFVNGRLVGTGVAPDPLPAVDALFELAARHDLPVEPGQWVSTGAIGGAHKVAPGDRYEATFGSSAVACRLVSWHET